MTNKELVTQFFMDGYVHHNFNSLLNILAENYLDHSPCAARTNQECVHILKNTATSFSDMRVKILDLIEEDNKVTVRALFSCKHTGEAFDLPATNKDVQFEALEIFRIRDNKIVESWGYWPDRLIIQQLMTQCSP